jgi:hypothetical protein
MASWTPDRVIRYFLDMVATVMSPPQQGQGVYVLAVIVRFAFNGSAAIIKQPIAQPVECWTSGPICDIGLCAINIHNIRAAGFTFDISHIGDIDQLCIILGLQ